MSIPQIQRIRIRKTEGIRKIDCCYCDQTISRSILPHLREKHPDEWQSWRQEMLDCFNKGMNPKQIMNRIFTVDREPIFTWSVIEKEIHKMVEEGRRIVPPVKEEVKIWEPAGFSLEKGTVWRFPRRGDWATHQGVYRGNWPPQVPRNLILRYTHVGDCVIDPFVGGGTTIVECKLLGRNAFGFDISPYAVDLTKRQLEVIESESRRQNRELPNSTIIVDLCDARDLSLVDDDSVDLVCTHPPYFNSLRYTDSIKEDLSGLNVLGEFLSSLRTVGCEFKRVLRPGGTCGILIGDVRKKGKITPLAFKAMETFQGVGFQLKEIIIKEQFNDRSSAFYLNSDFYRIEFEYLFIFEKPV